MELCTWATTLTHLEDKFTGHNVSELTFGYIVHPEKKEYEVIDHKIALIEEEYGVNVGIFLFKEWVEEQLQKAKNEGVAENDVTVRWLYAYIESLALKRQDKAPIDEPTYSWLHSLNEILK